MSETLIANLFVFVLATFLGIEVIRRVSPLLHTPLMSLTNAISAISLVGSLVLLGEQTTTLSTILGGLAVIASSINVVSGFLITDRMLRMFKKREPAKGAPAQSLLAPVFFLAAAEVILPPTETIIQVSYVFAAAMFVMALKWMNHPTTARNGNYAGILGMVVAVGGTLLTPSIVNYQWIAVALLIGVIVGFPIGYYVAMTAVPQRTAVSHSFGGLAVGLVGTAEYTLGLRFDPSHVVPGVEQLTTFKMCVIGLEVLLGFITFTGSLMAFGKLQEILPTRPLVYKGQNLVNGVLFAIAVGLAIYLVVDPTVSWAYALFATLAVVFGVLLIIPIGGADMPTVISLLNSYAGLSASAMGFVLKNPLLIVAGALDGSSGLILSIIMCKAMNRSFTNVLFGAFGQVQTRTGVIEERSVRSAGAEEAASILEAANTVVIIPGYGMAVAQAQHKVRELYDALTKRGIDVKFAIHPVAGRMPGHMNVLLAEADIPYDRLIEMDDINAEFPQTDVALVIGANDVTNPAARTDTTSPIYGMPILDVDKAHTVMVIKRSMSSGFAGVDNELYFMDKTLMLFGDAKSFVGEIVKSLGSNQ